MDISNIKEGDIFKNYKEICKVLGEKEKGGKSKQYQLKEWERYFEYEKQGHKFKIVKIYDKPKEKEDLRSDNGISIYIEDIERLILDLLTQDKNNGQLFLSRSMLLKELKMINDNYSYYRNNKPTLSKFTNISLEEINEFYELSNSTLKTNLETALSRLRKQSLIYWTYALTVCFLDTKIETTETGEIKAYKHTYKNEQGEIITEFTTAKPKQNITYRKANKREIQIILDIEKETLKEFNCNSKSELYRQGKIEDYYKIVQDKLFDKTNIIYYYNSYEIIYNDRHIKEKLKELELEEHNKIIRQTYLNNQIINTLNSNAQKRHEKTLSKYLKNGFGNQNLNKKDEMRINENYVNNQKSLSETLIRKDKPILKNSNKK